PRPIEIRSLPALTHCLPRGPAAAGSLIHSLHCRRSQNLPSSETLPKIARSMNPDKGRVCCRLQAHYVLTVKRLGSRLLASTRASKRADFDVARPVRVLWFETSCPKFNLKKSHYEIIHATSGNHTP